MTSRMSARCEVSPRASTTRSPRRGDALREMYEIWNEFDGHVRSIAEER